MKKTSLCLILSSKAVAVLVVSFIWEDKVWAPAGVFEARLRNFRDNLSAQLNKIDNMGLDFFSYFNVEKFHLHL